MLRPGLTARAVTGTGKPERRSKPPAQHRGEFSELGCVSSDACGRVPWGTCDASYEDLVERSAAHTAFSPYPESVNHPATSLRGLLTDSCSSWLAPSPTANCNNYAKLATLPRPAEGRFLALGWSTRSRCCSPSDDLGPAARRPRPRRAPSHRATELLYDEAAAARL